VLVIESSVLIRKTILGIVVLGIALGIYLFGYVVIHGVNLETFSGNLFYNLEFIPFYELDKYLYLLVASVPFIIASNRQIGYLVHLLFFLLP
jgi:hypothetical protein